MTPDAAPRGRQTKQPWVFTRYFRANAYGWKASRLASQRLREAVTEIRAAARKDPQRGMEGAVVLTERLVAAVSGIDDSWGIFGGALYKQYERLAPVFSSTAVAPEVRLTLLRRLLAAWLADEYGYLDLIPRVFPTFVSDTAEAEVLVPEFMEIAEVYSAQAEELQERCDHPHGWDFDASRARVRRDAYRRMATEIRLAFLDASGALEAALEHDFHDNGVTLMRALLKQGRVDDARAVIEGRRIGSSHGVEIEGPWFELLVEAGELEHARAAGVAWLAQKPTLERFRKVVKALPGQGRTELARDAAAATDELEMGRWFATFNHLGLHEDAARIAREHVVAPETALRAAKKYEDSYPDLAFESYVAAVAGFVSWGELSNDAYIAYSVLAPARAFAQRVGRETALAARLCGIEGLKRYPTAWAHFGGASHGEETTRA